MTAAAALLAKLSVFVFTLSTMFGSGLGLAWRELARPLRSVSWIVRALLASFVLAPLLAWGIAFLFRLEAPLAAGLLILGATAGAPVLPKLAQIAKADVASAVGLMVLLMVVTIGLSPLLLPGMLPGVQIDPWGIARPQILWMLIPLTIGLFVRARYPEAAAELELLMNQVSTFSIAMVMVLLLLLTYEDLWAAIGTGAFLAAGLFIILTFFCGFLLAGRDPGQRVVLGIATGQRNISAAMLIASLNFQDPKVLVMVLIASLMMLVLGLAAAGELGRRAAAPRAVIGAD